MEHRGDIKINTEKTRDDPKSKTKTTTYLPKVIETPGVPTDLVNYDNLTGDRVILPQIAGNSTPPQRRNSHYSPVSPPRIKTACILPAIPTQNVQKQPCQTLSSTSDPTQTNTAAERKTNILKASKTPPKIIPPIMKIPKTQKEIRNFFQTPKRKTKKTPQNSPSYDILIVDHNQRS
jgi:hypothetical protein